MLSYFTHFLRSWHNHFTMQFSTWVVLASSFTVVTFAILFHQNLDRVLSHWGDSIKMSVYLKDDQTDISPLYEKLKSKEGVEEVEFISKEEAAKLFREQVKNYIPENLLEDQADNPLPASFEIKFNSEWSMSKISNLMDFAKELTADKLVEDVSYGQGWVKNYATLVDKFNASSWMLISILLFGTLFVIGNSIRNSISQRKEEIEILELVGSTPSSIRTPYIIEGVLMGGLSALTALFISRVLFDWQLRNLDSGIGVWGGDYTLQFLNIGQQAFIFFIGIVFGWLGAYLCIRQINNGWSAQRNESI